PAGLGLVLANRAATKLELPIERAINFWVARRGADSMTLAGNWRGGDENCRTEALGAEGDWRTTTPMDSPAAWAGRFSAVDGTFLATGSTLNWGGAGTGIAVFEDSFGLPMTGVFGTVAS